jgi:hypothetical protein
MTRTIVHPLRRVSAPLAVVASLALAACGDVPTVPEVVVLKSIRLPVRPRSCTARRALLPQGVALRPGAPSGISRWILVRLNQGEANATDGFISKISKDGALVQLNWVAGLGNPTGMRILDGKLFVADPLLHATQPNYAIVMIDIATGTVRRTYTLDLSLMNNPNRGLNDLAIDKATNALYASVFDTRPGFGETIIKVPLDGDGSTATQFVVPGSVGIRPNGVLIHKRDLIVMSGSGLFSRVGLDTRVVEAWFHVLHRSDVGHSILTGSSGAARSCSRRTDSRAGNRTTSTTWREPCS